MKANHMLARILSLALILTLLFSFASCDLLKGSLKLESFTVDRSSVKTEYFVGEEIDFSGIRATVRYSDEDLNVEYTIEDLTISYPADITDTTGTKLVTVSFEDPHLGVKQETTVQITVKEDPNAVKHDRYVVDSSAMKKDYLVGETISFDGVKIIEKFTNGGADVEMTDTSKLSYEYNPDITASHGVYTVSVKYNGEDAGTITITVTDPSLDLVPVTSIVVTGEYKDTYEKDDEVDLTGLTVTVTYSDGTVEVIELSELEISDISTDSVGVKNAVITFTDPVNETPLSTSVSITVIEAKLTVIQFEKNEYLTAFDSDNKTAGQTGYGEAGFSGEFLTGGKLYVIGDDNAFKMSPAFSLMDKTGVMSYPNAFYSVVDIYVAVEDEYVLLEKIEAQTSNTYVYTLDGATVATVDTYYGSYKFEAPVEAVKISVLPDAEYYKGTEELNPVVLEAKVIDAYNVHETWELAVIDNDTSRTDWDTFKLEHGISGINPKGVVIHRDLHISADDVPASFFNESTKDVTYVNKPGETILDTQIAPAGTRYLIDGTVVYERLGADGFSIEGNFFTVDTKSFPLVASPAVFDSSLGLDYGGDYSNAVLFRFSTHDGSLDWTRDDSVVSTVSIENIAFIGNAARDNWLDEGEKLVTAGGLIMLKSANGTTVAAKNVINNSFFISYFAEMRGHLDVTGVKCYDSYQNALFIWGDCRVSVADSFINGTGGPIAINMSVLENNEYFSPEVQFDNTVLETALSGSEVWFKAVNATSIIGGIQALGYGVDQMVSTATGGQMNANWVDATGNMNILSVLMPKGNDTSALQDGMIEGTVTVDGNGIERWYNPATPENINPDWVNILQNPAFAAGAPFITAFDAEGNAHTLYFVQQGDSGTFYDVQGRVLGTDVSHQAIIMAFATSEIAVLHQGGLSVIFELNH